MSFPVSQIATNQRQDQGTHISRKFGKLYSFLKLNEFNKI